MALPTLDEALHHLRMDLDEAPSDWADKERAYVQGLLDEAVDYVRGYCRRNVFPTAEDLASAVEAGTAGSDPLVVSGEIRRAILMLMGAWNENREAVNVGNIVNELPFGVKAILDRHRRGHGV